ncbi:MAG: DUF721 domain-containing protein [Paludibacter sp.]|nr:DUF721 domain-containing protein [Paludibacter sp.]
MRRNKTVPLSEILVQVLHEQHLEIPLLEKRIIEGWTEVMGKTISAYTTDIYLKNRTLYLQISSSVLRHELFLQRQQIKEKMNEFAKQQYIKEIILK